jgi:hypothetical protein
MAKLFPSDRIGKSAKKKYFQLFLADFDPDTDPMPADAIFTFKSYRYPLAPNIPVLRF